MEEHERDFDASERQTIRAMVQLVNGNGKTGLATRVQRIENIGYVIAVGLFALFLQGLFQFRPMPQPGHTIITPQNAATNGKQPQSAVDDGTVPPVAAKLRGGYTTSEYAKLAGVSVRTIQQQCLEGKLQCVKADNGAYLIEITE